MQHLFRNRAPASRTRRHRAAAAGKSQVAVDNGSIDRIILHHPSHGQPPPYENRARFGAPRLCSFSGSSVDPVPTVPIQHATHAASPDPPLLGALPPEAHRRVSTSAALPEMPSTAEIEFIESVKRYSHTDWAREQRAEPVCDAAIRYLLGNPSVLPDDFLLHLADHKRPRLSEVCSLADKGRLYTDDDGILLLVLAANISRPGLSSKAWRAGGLPLR